MNGVVGYSRANRLMSNCALEMSQQAGIETLQKTQLRIINNQSSLFCSQRVRNFGVYIPRFGVQANIIKVLADPNFVQLPEGLNRLL